MICSKVAELESLAKLEEKLNGEESSISALQQQLDSLTELRGEYKSNLALAIQLLDNIKSLEEKLIDKEILQKEYRIIEGLVKFFSPRGFKLYELKRRCEGLIEQANYWTPSFFQERHEWSISKDINDLDFLVQPVKHRKTQPFSASLFSLGEENRAARVLLFSQIALIPPNKKNNLLFLDEIEGNLDEAGFTAFNEVVIPKLKAEFPDRTIIIMTPLNKLSEVFDHLWIAERKNRKTTLLVN